MNENETTTITIQLNDLNTRQPSTKSLIMVFVLFAIGGVKWLKVETNTPAIINDAASIPKVIAAPKVSIKIPADAAPVINPALVAKELIAFAFCNPASGTIEGIIPVNAGQNMPDKSP